MAYKPNIPAATDKLSVSQGDLQGNFQAIDDGSSAGFAKNHVSLTEVSDVGKHKKVDLIDLTGSAPTPDSGQVVLFNADDVASGSGRKELWCNNNSALTYPITAGKRAVAGWARIGGGIYLIWNSVTSDANTSADTTLDLSHCPASGTLLSAQVTPFPSSVSGTDNNYVVQVTGLSGSVTVGVFTRATASATRLASKRFTYLVVRL